MNKPMNRTLFDIKPRSVFGKVSAISGLNMTVVGLVGFADVGGRCKVHTKRAIIEAEVIAVDSNSVLLLPFGTWAGASIGDSVELVEFSDLVTPDESWLGRVVDALGRPLNKPDTTPRPKRPDSISLTPPNAMRRRRVGAKLETKVAGIDIFTPLCRGQRIGVFAGSGVGKSTLMAMLARNVEADVVVIGLVGERGREVQDFIEEDLGPEGLAKSVVVVATGDEAPLLRKQAALTATRIAETFRAEGKHVLLLVDSVTRFAMAQRDIGMTRGEPLASRGYPASVFSELPQLLERAGPGHADEGDITAVYTILVDGDDMNEPVSDAVRGILDGHIILDRKIAENGRYPAIDLLGSVSRMLPGCHSPEEYEITRAARRTLGRYADMEDLIRVGAYRSGTDAEVDASIRFQTGAVSLLTQTKEDQIGADTAFAQMYQVMLEAGVEDPLAQFFEQAQAAQPDQPQPD